MKTIEQIDQNFKIETSINKSDIKFYDVKKAPFEINGVFFADNKFRRMPENIARQVSSNVYGLHTNTAGGRVRFCTDSPYVAISFKTDFVGKMAHFTMCGSSGFDIYADDKYNGEYIYRGTFVPPFDYNDGYDAVVEFDNTNMRTVVINFPLYSNICELYIGLSDASMLTAPKKYNCNFEKPIVYYGSSITQGGCVSRPGLAYQAIISRRLDCDFVNLGFSGSARAEDSVADYIKGLEMSLFVYDYDHNAPNVEYYKSTHEKMFKKIREAQPNLPIIIMTRPKISLNNEEKQRLKVALSTYNNAIANGDRNVYFISGTELMQYVGEEGTVDLIHPNDLGAASMAKVLGDFIDQNLMGGQK